MTDTNERWLVAAWPGAGHVATTAAVYLLSRLRMHQIAEFAPRDLFEVEGVDVHSGLVSAATLPRSRLFLWKRPTPGPDILVFLGEAQPSAGKSLLCARLLASARKLGVKRVFTFAAIVADMDPKAESRTFGIATDPASLGLLRREKVAIFSDGEIGGLNGVLLAAAAEAGLPGIGLLAEAPSYAAQLPYASASAAVLRVFLRLARLELDLHDLEEYGRSMQEQFSLLYGQIRQALGEAGRNAPEPPQPPRSPSPAPDDEARRIEALFSLAKRDRSKAFELKKELDRSGRFRQYEDRFLDLFEPP